MKKIISLILCAAILLLSVSCAVKVDSDFSPVAGTSYVAYVYVQYVCDDGFAGSGDFSDGVFVKCKNAKDFKILDTVRVVFDGADYKVESNSFESEWGGFKTEQTIEKSKAPVNPITAKTSRFTINR